jgi:cobalt transporter subunit CbtA
MQRVVMAALIAGALAGFAAFALHMWQTTPLILHAEVYEAGEASHDHATAQSQPTKPDDHAASQSHSHGDEAWPAEGFERSAYSLLADVITSIGFAFLLLGAIAMRGRDTGWQQGIIWGLCGYAAFYVAPALGMAPELPGMVGAELGERQIWWLGTSLATALALAMLFFTSGTLLKVVAALLMLVPHVIGAPHPVIEPGNVPAELAAQFAVASLVVSGLFWMVLGGLGGYFYDRFEPS